MKFRGNLQKSVGHLFRLSWVQRENAVWEDCDDCGATGFVDVTTGKAIKSKGGWTANAVEHLECQGRGKRWRAS